MFVNAIAWTSSFGASGMNDTPGPDDVAVPISQTSSGRKILDYVSVFLAQLVSTVIEPVKEIIAHTCVSIAFVVCIQLTEFAMQGLGIINKKIPLISITIGEWMLDFEIVSVSIIIGSGIIKGTMKLWETEGHG